MNQNKRHISIMGIANLTGNSYFADSRCLDGDGQLDLHRFDALVRRHLEAGADLIDLGACSTRPGSAAVGAGEEWRRLEPALDFLQKEYPGIQLSIDTYWASVVQKAYDRIGPFWVNDISAGEDDPEMLSVTGRLHLPYIAMHKRGTPETMQQLTDYPDDPSRDWSPVTAAVYRYFEAFARKARENGITRWVLDPGFGFAKTLDQNWQLMKEMPVLLEINPVILVGVSRKSMLSRLFGISPEEALPATSALHMAALWKGAGILRVHDVEEARQTVEIFEKCREQPL